jgi:hypothetical protein
LLKTLFRRRDASSAAEAAAPGHTYAYKASLIGAAHRYELTDEGLLWRTGRRSGVWAYADIVAIRLSYRPMGMLAAEGSMAKLNSGLRPGIYTMIVAALAFVGLAMTALLLRALFTGEFAGVVFIIGFAMFFGWQISGFIRRNKPRNYAFDSVPDELLP